jgi:hypothetical protein
MELVPLARAYLTAMRALDTCGHNTDVEDCPEVDAFDAASDEWTEAWRILRGGDAEDSVTAMRILLTLGTVSKLLEVSHDVSASLMVEDVEHIERAGVDGVRWWMTELCKMFGCDEGDDDT